MGSIVATAGYSFWAVVRAEVVQMFRRLSTELGVLTDRLSALEPNVLVSLVGLTCLWIIWTVYVWTQNPFSR